MNRAHRQQLLSLAPCFAGGQLQIFGQFDHGGKMLVLAPISDVPRVEGQRIICCCTKRYTTNPKGWFFETGTEFTLPGNIDLLELGTLPSGRTVLWFNSPRDETIAVLFPVNSFEGTETFTEPLEWDCHPMDIEAISRMACPIADLITIVSAQR